MLNDLKNILEIDLPAGTQWCISVHYSEIGLKGKNRGVFEKQLMQNIERVLKSIANIQIERVMGRFLIHLPLDSDWQTAIARLERVFGIAYFSPSILLDQELEKITRAACSLMKAKRFDAFRVETRRSQKQFPFNSQEINTRVGAEIQAQTGARVNLKHPDITCHIEIFDRQALIYADKIPGLRGLPVGVSERAVSLLSSGIDSPVASWRLMKRGVKLIFAHFHSLPFTSRASITNTRRLVEILTQYQLSSRLYLIPFLEIQQAIMTGARPDYRVIHYRRAMVRIAEMIADKEHATALVTGESIGQVASQTLSNLLAINEATKIPILRPLAGNDKEEIIEQARILGTLEISIEPYEDCCSLFVPRHPITRADLETVLETEKKLNLRPLLEKALKAAEIVKFKFPA